MSEVFNKGLVFGTFDGLHLGHTNFLKKSRLYAKTLYASVARDEHVKVLKHKIPLFDEQTRLRGVLDHVEGAQLSDIELGSFEIINNVNPDVIVLGFDQTDLKKEIESWMLRHDLLIPVVTLEKYETDKTR